MAQAYKEYGNYERSNQLFAKVFLNLSVVLNETFLFIEVIELDKNYVQAYHLRALAHFGVGNHRAALQDLNVALSLDPSQTECRYMRAVVQNGLGWFFHFLFDVSNTCHRFVVSSYK